MLPEPLVLGSDQRVDERGRQLGGTQHGDPPRGRKAGDPLLDVSARGGVRPHGGGSHDDDEREGDSYLEKRSPHQRGALGRPVLDVTTGKSTGGRRPVTRDEGRV